MTQFHQKLLPKLPGNCKYQISSYGDNFRRNKALIKAACDKEGLQQEHYALLLQMAFLETTSLDAKDRDATKDGDGGAANYQLWNLSADLVRQAGYKGDLWVLNRQDQIPAVVKVIKAGLDKWGVERTLNFVRGGRSAFEDGISYGAYDYRDVIATTLKVLDSDTQLLYDTRRAACSLQHVQIFG